MRLVSAACLLINKKFVGIRQGQFLGGTVPETTFARWLQRVVPVQGLEIV
jgi:hypothetical protein